MTVTAIRPRGFCSGVKAALRKAYEALDGSAHPVYGLHALVHNEAVVADLTRRGMVFVDELDAVPEGATLVISAHGVSPAVRRAALARRLALVDATCPFVARIHRQARAYAAAGMPVILVGDAQHQEVKGVAGEVADAGGRVAVVGSVADAAGCPVPETSRAGVLCQTTRGMHDVQAIMGALRVRYAALELPPVADVCTATHERQSAVARFVQEGGDGVLVVGSATSSNTRRLAEIARAAGARVFCVADASALAGCDFSAVTHLGVTGGASTPEDCLTEVMKQLEGDCK